MAVAHDRPGVARREFTSCRRGELHYQLIRWIAFVIGPGLAHGSGSQVLRHVPWQQALMFDPQTAGPLLAGIPVSRAAACVAALHEAGETSAAIIGHALSGDVRILTGKT